METVLASRNSTERKGEPEIDFVGPVYSNRTGIIARGRDTVLPVNDTSPKLRPADAGKPGMVRKLVEAGLAGASVLLGRAGMKMTASLVWREKATDALVRMSAAALLVGKAAAAPPLVGLQPSGSCLFHGHHDDPSIGSRLALPPTTANLTGRVGGRDRSRLVRPPRPRLRLTPDSRPLLDCPPCIGRVLRGH